MFIRTTHVTTLIGGGILALAVTTNLFASDPSPTPSPRKDAKGTTAEKSETVKPNEDKTSNSRYGGMQFSGPKMEKSAPSASPTPVPSPSPKQPVSARKPKVWVDSNRDQRSDAASSKKPKPTPTPTPKK